MLFKRFFYSTVGSSIFSALVGIVFAYFGFGIWALVAQRLCNDIISTCILWFTVKWRPKKLFSFERLKGLFSYGWKLLASSLIDTVYADIRQLIIGKMYTTDDLAFYNKGKQYPNYLVSNINSSINSVLLPTMASEQDNRTRLKAMTRRAIKISTYLIMPMMMGFAVCAEPIIRIVLTEKWLPCVFFVRVFCYTMAFYPIHTANLNAIKAMGRSDLFLKLEIIKKAVGIVALVISMWMGVKAMAYSLMITTMVAQVINSFPNKKLLDYSYLQQIKDMLPQILLSFFMGTVVYCVTFLHLNDYLTLLIQVPLGIVIYFGCSALFRLESFTYMLGVTKKYIKRK
jgi:O-antigen/teichoic acid export membrane protein